MKKNFIDHHPIEPEPQKWWPGSVVLLILQILLGLFLSITFYFETLSMDNWYILFFFFITYQIMLTFILLIGYYTQLRNIKIYVAWLMVAIAQTIIYYKINSILDLSEKDFRYLTTMRTLLPMLLSFQFFRLLFKRITSWELIIPYGRSDWYDEADNRKITRLDVIFSILIFSIIICALVL